MSAAGLRLRDVGAAPGGTPVLQGVDLEVPAGTTTAVIGASGAGKTTLLRVVAGLEVATTGSVLVDGVDVTGVAAHHRRVGVVFQEPRLFPHRTVTDNVAFGLEAAGVGRDERRAVADALLERVGLGGFGPRGVTALSGGEQQRVNLARALAIDPAVLLLDEPMAAADPELRGELRAVIAAVTQGVTCLHVTHDRSEAAELGDDVAVLVAGRLVQHGPAREVFEQPVSLAVARLVGATTVLIGELRGGRLLLAGGSLDLGTAAADAAGAATVTIRPEDVLLGAGELVATVTTTTYQGSSTRVVLTLDDGQTVTADVPVDAAPTAGTTVTVDVRRAWLLPTP